MSDSLGAAAGGALKLWLQATFQGARACWRRPLASFGGFALLTGVIFGGCVLPWFNFLFLLVLLAPLFGGYPHLILALLDQQPFRFPLFWAGFRQYERFLSLFWLTYLMTIFLCFPLLITLWLVRHTSLDGRLGVGLGIGISTLLWIGLMHRYLFVFFLAAERPRETTVDEILRTSEALIAPQRGRVIAVSFALLLFGAAGGLLFLLPVRGGGLMAGAVLGVTLPVAGCGLGWLYRSMSAAAE